MGASKRPTVPHPWLLAALLVAIPLAILLYPPKGGREWNTERLRRFFPDGAPRTVSSEDSPTEVTSRTTARGTDWVGADAPEEGALETAGEWRPPVFTERFDERRALVESLRDYGLRDEAVLQAMLAVPRHEFVPERMRWRAYEDGALPVGFGQTISQPYIVAHMTRLLSVDPGERVLEIGTGTGYQAAVLAHLTPKVYSIEIIRPLARAAAERLERLGYTTIRVRHGDGYAGWPEAAPFDGILVTCAIGHIPLPLVEQLAPGGRMVLPLGSASSVQRLTLVEKTLSGPVKTRTLDPVRFVPFLRDVPSGPPAPSY